MNVFQTYFPKTNSWRFPRLACLRAYHALRSTLLLTELCGSASWEFNSNFGSNLGLFGSGRGFNGRGAPVGFICTDFQLRRSHGDPFHASNSRLCATGSNSGAPGSHEISPLTSRTALVSATCCVRAYLLVSRRCAAPLLRLVGQLEQMLVATG